MSEPGKKTTTTKKPPKQKEPPSIYQPVLDFITSRITTRQAVLKALVKQPLDSSPEVVFKMREEESRIHRAIIQEQEDLLASIKNMKA